MTPRANRAGWTAGRWGRPRRPLRVAYFSGTLRPGHDGVTRVLDRLIAHLAERRVDNVFFSPILPAPAERSTTMYGVPSLAFPWYTDYRLAFSGSRYFESRVRAFRPDLLHIHSPCPLGWSAARYGRKLGIPVVATYHTHFPSYVRYYTTASLETFTWRYLHSVYDLCDELYVPSAPLVGELSRHGIRNSVLLPHGVDTRAFAPSFRSGEWRRQHGLEGKCVLLYVGRLVWEKDLRTLAESYRILREKRVDLEFVLVGDGPVRGELQQLMPRARFLGYQSGEDLATAYASSDILVFPSQTETFGNVVIEAMASGLPPVCVRAGGAYATVEHGVTGLHAAPGNPPDLAAAVESLADRADMRLEMGRRGVLAAAGYSWETILDRMLRHYAGVVASRREGGTPRVAGLRGTLGRQLSPGVNPRAPRSRVAVRP